MSSRSLHAAPSSAPPQVQQKKLAVAAHAAVCESYIEMEKAILDPAFRAANKQFSQPWFSS